MTKIISPLLLIAVISCNPSKQTPGDNRLNTMEKNEGWKLLFDGKTTSGWHRYGGGKIDSVWKVTDGNLWLDVPGKKSKNVKGDWDIVTDEEFGDFELQLEWKISPNGNSGIIFYIHENKQKYNWPWETGPEMQVLDNNGHPDAKHKTHRAGDLYDMLSCSKETVKPAGEWNMVSIRSEKGRLNFYLNGVNVVSTSVWDHQWRKMIAGSKFKKMPDFGTYKTGRIGLQDHGDIVYYRSIKIRRL